MATLLIESAYLNNNTQLSTTDTTVWAVNEKSLYRFYLSYLSGATRVVDKSNINGSSWLVQVTSVITDLKLYAVKIYNNNGSFPLYTGGSVVFHLDKLWLALQNTNDVPGAGAGWSDMFGYSDTSLCNRFDMPSGVLQATSVPISKIPYVATYPKLAISLTPNTGRTSLVVKDNTDWQGKRNDFALLICYSSDIWDISWLYRETLPTETQWTINLPVAGNYYFKVTAIPLWDNLAVYSAYNFIATSTVDAFNAVTGYKYYEALKSTYVTPSNDFVNFSQHSPVIDAEDFVSRIGGMSNNLSVDVSASFLTTQVFTTKKTGGYQYLVTPPNLWIDYTVNIFTFEQYLNNNNPTSVINISGRNGNGNNPFPITVPGDNVYVVAIEGNSFNSYFVLYCFDSLRAAMKVVLHNIFCPIPVLLCYQEQREQMEKDRIFITKVTAAMQTLFGVIHAEQIDYGLYYDISATRLAALQYANDIMQKTLILLSEYKSDITLIDHRSC